MTFRALLAASTVLTAAIAAAEVSRATTPVSEVKASAPDSKPAAQVAPDPRAFLFEAQPADFSTDSYSRSVESLIFAYERDTGRKLKPGKIGKVALKLHTSSGPGLSTPKALTEAVCRALEKRGFSRKNILLVDQQEKRLRESGYLPELRLGEDSEHEGSPVLAWDSGKHFDPKPGSQWTYPSPLPSKEIFYRPGEIPESDNPEKISPLPMPLLFGVDFWINLPMACDNATIGVSGALANATLLNVGNARRFWGNPANAQRAIVEIAAIPEFREKWELTILSLESYQFLGGPKFESSFTLSEKRLWLSANPVILDYLMWKRINAGREQLNKNSNQNMPLIDPEPDMFFSANAGEIHLGSCRPNDLRFVSVK